MPLVKWMTVQELKKPKVTMSCNRQKFVKNHDGRLPGGVRYIKEKYLNIYYLNSPTNVN